MTTSATPAGKRRRRFWSSQPFLAGVAVVAVVLAVALVWAAVHYSGAPRNAFQGVPAPTPTRDTQRPLSGGNSACGLTKVERSGELKQAPPTTWTRVGRIDAPSVEGHGPGRVEADGYRGCYARTPTGSLLYFANLLAMFTDDSTRTRMAPSTTPSTPGVTPAPLPTAQVPPGRQSTFGIAGFRLEQYEGAELSRVSLVLKLSFEPDALYFVWEAPMTWLHGDWVIDPNYGSPTWRIIPNLDGYVPWSKG